ncbi:MAG: bifunctional 5,10-methylenetetrahydrofolate dehydrogenase/5,10-methenyltetrahydrofolate cyclohydrolase [Candidatus Jorgensenbacteria bacterium]|nr:bifunctional 5,10-methylenetetrahydrofolate dehydrogenase/5,10-methenyltetrahydrofolate cyclohydrolase [Candidatus Jorgensenbacteria bacterium]
MVINGKEIAANIISSLKEQKKTKKYLAAILIGENSASISFLKQKEKVADELGVKFKLTDLPEGAAENTIIKTISNLEHDNECGGIIIQLPLPSHLDREKIISAIPKGKDIDALNGGDVLPPAVGVVEKILLTLPAQAGTHYSLQTSAVAVVGLGTLVGKPISKWLSDKAKELILVDEKDDINVIKNADIVIVGVGKPGLITPEMLKENALVIDFGYSMKDEKLSGDFDSTNPACAGRYSLPTTNYSYTPTPGGTGPILVAKLFENFYKLNK